MLALIDAVLLNACILGVFSVRFIHGMPDRNISAYQNNWFYITAIFACLFYFNGLYDFDEDDDGVSILFKVFSSVSFGTISIMALTFLSRNFEFPRTVIIISYFLLNIMYAVLHIVVQRRFRVVCPSRHIMILGGDARCAHIEKMVLENPQRYTLEGCVNPEQIELLYEAAGEGRINFVAIMDDVEDAQEIAFRLDVEYPGLRVYFVPRVEEIMIGTRHDTVIGDVPLVAFASGIFLKRYFLLKRLTDIVISVIGLLALSPFLLLIAVGIKLTSKGPVFYSQDRVGRDGKLFDILKFRTMVKGAEEPTGPMLSSDHDPRVTLIGKPLRRFKLDEMPQLINVIKGDMSLVGPRPERPEFVEKFEQSLPAYVYRKKVLPGMTGIAQVCGRYETDPSLKLKYDLIYIYNYNPWMDFALIYQTFQYILRSNI